MPRCDRQNGPALTPERVSALLEECPDGEESCTSKEAGIPPPREEDTRGPSARHGGAN
jgi:hypothetical protein